MQTRLNVLSDSREMCHVQAALHSVLSGIPGQAVICTDWTQLDLLSPKLADSVTEMLTATSVKVLRGAILLQAEKATLNLQVERVIREAGSTSRRTFREAKKMLDWLAEVLTPEELLSAKQFLRRPG